MLGITHYLALRLSHIISKISLLQLLGITLLKFSQYMPWEEKIGLELCPNMSIQIFIVLGEMDQKPQKL